MADVSAEIKSTIQVFVNAVAEDKPENAATIFADDCVILDHGNKVNKGKEGAKAHFAAVKAPGTVSLKPVEGTVEIGSLGDGFAFHMGLWDALNKGGAKVTTFQDLVVWKKTGNGWQVFREHSNHC